MSIDLSQLPPPNVVEELDYETILAARKARLLELTPADERAALAAALALESEPLSILLEENAYREMILRQRVNEAARALLLAFAKGADLDHLAANYDVRRLTVRPADPAAVPPVPVIMELDADLIERTQLAFEGLSVAGPRMAYIFHARAADGRIADISAISPEPCDVLISVLSREGDGTAPQDLLEAVAARLGDDEVRPVADRVTVQSASIVPYSVSATLHLYPGPESEPILAAAKERLQAFVGVQRRIGRDIRRSALFAALHVAGVQRVELAEPVIDVVISATQSAYCTAATVELGDADE